MCQSDSPQLTNSPSTIGTVGVVSTYNASCSEPDVGITYWQLNTDAAWLLMTSNSTNHCNLSGSPVGEGDFYVNLSLNDDDSGDYLNWTITVSGSLPAPSITTTEVTGVREDHLYSSESERRPGRQLGFGYERHLAVNRSNYRGGVRYSRQCGGGAQLLRAHISHERKWDRLPELYGFSVQCQLLRSIPIPRFRPLNVLSGRPICLTRTIQTKASEYRLVTSRT